MPAGRAQPRRGHHLLGHPAATSPVGTGATTATSRQAKSSSQSLVWDEAGDRQQRGQAGATRTCCGGSVALTCVSQPRTSCCHHDALPRCVAVPHPVPRGHAELLRMEPCLGKTGRKQVKWLFLPSCLQGMEYEQLTTDSRWCPPPAAGLGVMGAATGMCPPGDTCQGCACQPCPHSALARGAPAMQCLPDPPSH